MSQPYFATVAQGLEEAAAKELENLGAQDIKIGFTVIHFQGDQSLLYRVNLWSRLLYRIFVPIAEIKSKDAEQLFQEVKHLPWEKYLHPQQTFAVKVTGKNPQLNHSHFTALTIKNAIIEQQKKYWQQRSTIDTQRPNIILNAHIENTHCTLSLDSTGESLHRRGYRPVMGLAPLKETLAAAIIDLSEWTPNLPLYDPFCGSGTLLFEAAVKALNIAPGHYRSAFMFEQWSDFNAPLWQQIKKQAKQQQLTSFQGLILGSDEDEMMIQQAKNNANLGGFQDNINFTQKSLSDIEAPTSQGILLCNPPYGKRLGNEQELGTTYRLLGDILKQRFRGWTAYILSGNKALTKQIGLRTSRRISLYNGSLPCTLLKYELY